MKNDSIDHVLLDSEALSFLSASLPEDQGGLAHLLNLLAKDLAASGQKLDEHRPSALANEDIA